MVIDIHTHTVSTNAEYSPEYIIDAKRMAGIAGIDKIVYLFNLGSGDRDPSMQDIQCSNNLGMRLVSTAPDLYIGFCYLNPAHDPSFIRAELDRCITYGNLSGIKLWVAVHASDPRLDPIMHYAKQMDIPVLHHAWYKASSWAYNESSPAQIANLARRHPQTKIIMAHLAGARWRGILDVKEFPNVYIDTSGGLADAGLLEYAVQELGAHRILFGSDWPLRDFTVQKSRVTGAAISAEQKMLILGKNAAQLLGLLDRKRG